MAAPAPKANGGGPHFHFPHLPHLQLPHFFGGGQQRRRDGVAAASSSSAPGASSGGPPPKLAVNFSGRWQKDRARSSSMSAAMDVMRLGGVMRQAVKLVRGCDIAQTGETFTMDVTSVIGWFKVREVYRLDGSVANLRRRDWRGGELRAWGDGREGHAVGAVAVLFFLAAALFVGQVEQLLCHARSKYTRSALGPPRPQQAARAASPRRPRPTACG